MYIYNNDYKLNIALIFFTYNWLRNLLSQYWRFFPNTLHNLNIEGEVYFKSVSDISQLSSVTRKNGWNI